MPVVVVTGFVAATLEGSPTTLKRSGSDYSATIFARLMEARATRYLRYLASIQADRITMPLPTVTYRYLTLPNVTYRYLP